MKTIRPLAAAALFVTLLLTVSAQAQQIDKTEYPDTPDGRADAALMEMRLWIQNAQIKLKNGVTGAMSTEPSQAGPAATCCTKNLTRIREERKKLQSALREIRECYEARGDREAQRTLAVTDEDLDALMRSVEGFARTATVDMANRAIDSVQRSFLLLKQSRANMSPCEGQ